MDCQARPRRNVVRKLCEPLGLIPLCQQFASSAAARNNKTWRTVAKPHAQETTTPTVEKCLQGQHLATIGGHWRKWSGPELNRRHMDFQSIALPTELPDRGFHNVSRKPQFGERWAGSHDVAALRTFHVVCPNLLEKRVPTSP